MSTVYFYFNRLDGTIYANKRFTLTPVNPPVANGEYISIGSSIDGYTDGNGYINFPNLISQIYICKTHGDNNVTPFYISVPSTGSFNGENLIIAMPENATPTIFAFNALTSSYALTSSVNFNVGTTYPITTSWALNTVNGGSFLTTGSTYPITSSWSKNAVTSSNLIGPYSGQLTRIKSDEEAITSDGFGNLSVQSLISNNDTVGTITVIDVNCNFSGSNATFTGLTSGSTAKFNSITTSQIGNTSGGEVLFNTDNILIVDGVGDSINLVSGYAAIEDNAGDSITLNNGSVTIVGNTTLTGSLFGTSSFANQSLTASSLNGSNVSLPATNIIVKEISQSIINGLSLTNTTPATETGSGYIILQDSPALGWFGNTWALDGISVPMGFLAKAVMATGSSYPIYSAGIWNLYSVLFNAGGQYVTSSVLSIDGMGNMSASSLSASLFGTSSFAGSSISSSYLSGSAILSSLNVNGNISCSILTASLFYPLIGGYSNGVPVNDSVMIGFSGSNNNFVTQSVIIGYSPAYNVITSSRVVMIGWETGNNVISSSQCVLVGGLAAVNAGTVANATIIGYVAGQNATSASNTVIIGENAGSSATTCTNAIIIGASSGASAAFSTNTVIIGGTAGKNAVSSSNATLIGFQTGENSTTCSNAVMIGENAGMNATSAVNCVFIGNSAGSVMNSGSNQTADAVMIGFEAGQNILTGSMSTLVGYLSSQGTTNASGAAMLGAKAGFNSLTATNCTFLGLQADTSFSGSTFSGSIALGANSKVSGSNICAIGGTGSAAVKVSIGNNIAYNTLDVIGNISASVVTASLFFGTSSYANALSLSSLLPYRAGVIGIGSNVTNTNVSFSAALPSNGYTVALTYDTGSAFGTIEYTVNGKTTTGFTASLNAGLAAGVNLDWTAWLFN